MKSFIFWLMISAAFLTLMHDIGVFGLHGALVGFFIGAAFLARDFIK